MRCASIALALGLTACSPASNDGPDAPTDPAPPALAPVAERAMATLGDFDGFSIAAEGLDDIPAGDPPSTDDEARDAVRGLTEYAASVSGRDRELAMADLVALGDRAVIPAYEVAVDRELSPVQRMTAVDLLVELDSEASIESLFRAQRDCTNFPDSAYVRARAAWRLGELAREETVPQLTLRLKYETDPEAIVWLTWALARMGSLAGYAGVVEMVDTWNLSEELRATIAQHASELGERYGAATPHALLELWNEPGEDFPWAERGDAYDLAIWNWVERLEEYDLRVIDEARFLLPRLDRHGADLLADCLVDEGLYRRIHAAQCIGRMDGRARHRIGDVIAALNRPDIAERALEALAGIGGEEARLALENRLLAHRPPEIRITAAFALGALGDPASIQALEAAWPAPDTLGAREIEQAIAIALAKLGRHDEMLPRLAADLVDPALSSVPTREGILAWLTAHRDDDPWAAEQLDAMPPIGQDTTPLDAFWKELGVSSELAGRASGGVGSNNDE